MKNVASIIAMVTIITRAEFDKIVFDLDNGNRAYLLPYNKKYVFEMDDAEGNPIVAAHIVNSVVELDKIIESAVHVKVENKYHEFLVSHADREWTIRKWDNSVCAFVYAYSFTGSADTKYMMPEQWFDANEWACILCNDIEEGYDLYNAIADIDW